jgi:hypothetical protein
MKTNLGRNLINYGTEVCDTKMKSLLKRVKMYNLLLHLLIGLILLAAFAMTIDFIRKPKVIVEVNPGWEPLSYDDWKGLNLLGEIYMCWPEDSDVILNDSIPIRIDRLNEHMEMYHEFMSRGIQIYIQDQLVEISKEKGIKTMDYEPIPIDMFAED